MVRQSWLYDAIIYMYALSLLFYFSDMSRANRKVKRIGTGLLLFVWVLQTVYLIYGLYDHRAAFVFTLFETLFLFSWLLVTVSLVLERFFRIGPIVFVINLFAFAVLALNFFGSPKVMPTLKGWKVSDELLLIHISLAVASYVSFAVGAAFSGAYLFLHRKLKEKTWSASMKRLPSLETVDQYAYRSVLLAMPLLLLSLSLGLVWVILQGEPKLLYDPKVINTLFVLAAYAFYLAQRAWLRSSGYPLAIWNLAAFAVVLANFVISNLMSQFHRWIWM